MAFLFSLLILILVMKSEKAKSLGESGELDNTFINNITLFLMHFGLFRYRLGLVFNPYIPIEYIFQ